IPSGRQVLREHHCNLRRVADYCESNYLQASDQRKALEETMALSTQSLASVTYQVSSLATAFLRLLDLQAAELRKVEADISCVAQRVDMHKEKVSRREIGSLTISKRFPSCQKVVAPPSPPCLEPYYRKPLNFSVLDDIGHGIKVSPALRWGLGRVLPLPTVPSAALRGSQAAQWGGLCPSPPFIPLGLAGGSLTLSLLPPSSSGAPGEGIVPPPPPLPPSLPGACPAPAAAIPPPPPLPGDPELLPLEILPPAPDDLELPPPSPPALLDFEDMVPPPPPDAEEPPWAPERYLEKVVALYPYTQQKDNELSFQPGALLFVTRRYSDGWCEGVMGEEVGFFPGNYVEPL
ncbi:ABI3 protein, partial [Probosciger aterrimus]|nr:ABI3 protein [Probosciger aterrimus]